MEQGPDFWCWFDTTQFSYHCVQPIHAKMFSIQMLLHFSQIVQRVCTLVLFIVNIFKKRDREDPGNYRGITLLSVVGKVFCKILNNRLVQCLDKEGALHEGQAGFRLNRSCMDNVYTLNEIVQGRLREDKKTYAFFLDKNEKHKKMNKK